MAGRKKVTEEMVETEMQALEGAEMPSTGDPMTDEMDLNELLDSMDSEAQEYAGQESESFPDLSDVAASEGIANNVSSEEMNVFSDEAAENEVSEKPKRSSRRKKAETAPDEEQPAGETEDFDGDTGTDDSEEATIEDTVGAENTLERELPQEKDDETERQTAVPRRTSGKRKTEVPVLTLESRGEVETEDAREEIIWHEIHNAYRTRKILTGQLGGIEQTDGGKTIVIVDYKGFRIVIPLKEMMINLVQGRSPSGKEYAELMLRQNKILGNMLGAEIDFIVKGIDSKTRSVVASRREAMLKKRQIFYLDTDAEGMYRIYEGRVVQARVIAVAEKVVRVEIFGVECSIMARDLAWDWIGDAHERFSVGDQILVRIISVRRDSLEDMGVKADVKSVTQDTQHENLKKCRVQSKYAGKVTDVHKGVVYIRLANGVNAVAHACYDYRTPGKKDDVSFAVTKIDEERGVAVGIITRIIRQNL